MDARERAKNWLIEHNHHGCHLDVDPDAVMPLVDALAALLTAAEAEGRRHWAPDVDVMRTLELLARADAAQLHPQFHPSSAARERLAAWLYAVREP